MDHAVFKIDQTVFLQEHTSSDGYIFTEEPMSAQWTEAQQSRVTNMAIVIVYLLFTRDELILDH